MENLSIEKFNPTVADLQSLVAETKNIIASDLTDAKQLKVVKANRIKLRDARVTITKTGKQLREEANAFNKAVLSKEKDLLAIVEPEEERLKSIEQAAELLATIEARKIMLPTRRASLESIGDGVEISDLELLEMDDMTFATYRTMRVSAKEEAERAAQEAERQKAEREKELEEAKKQAAAEAEERAKREADERVAAERKAKEEAELKLREEQERQEREKREAEERAKVEQARLEKEKDYTQWLKDNGYDEKVMKLVDLGDEVWMYKLVAKYTK